MTRRGLVSREEMKQIFREAAKACKEEAAPYKKGERFQHFKECMRRKIHELYTAKTGLYAKA
jgi:hypothetical protein